MAAAAAARARLLVHLAGWAQAGALARLFLGRALGCGWAGAPCVTDAGGALFTDLPANVLGCGIMGLLTTSEALAHDLRLGHDPRLAGGPAAALAALPPGHGLQAHAALHVGLRTGFCGSLTTFASWHLQAVGMMVGDARPTGAARGGWVAAFASLLLGWLAALAAHAGGQHAAAALWQGHAAADGGRGRGSSGGGGGATAEPGTAAPLPLDKPTYGGEDGAVAALEAAAEVRVEAAPEEARPRDASRLAADALAAAALVTLTAVSVARLASGPERDDGRVWASLLMAPPGALLRLRLGALNGGRAGWLPAGTLAANLLACAIDFGVAAVLVRAGEGLSPGRAAALAGVIGGFGGCLSTVSTVAVEARKLLAARRGGAAAAYLFGSSAAAVALGLLIYGAAAWTAPP
jgi:fluoride ion exporter CrcB/FEX